MRALLGGMAMVLAAWQADAGAWPREEGTTFFSLSTNFSTGAQTLLLPDREIDRFTSLYGEYGLTPKLTLGFEASRARSTAAEISSALVFARYPVWQSETGHQVAVDFGLGFRRDGVSERETRIRTGLAWGKGFESRWGGGWMGVESSFEIRRPSGGTTLKADFTVGLKPTDRWMLIGQVQTGRYDGSKTILRLSPSVVRAVGKHTHVQLGVEAGVVGDDSLGLKLATWITF